MRKPERMLALTAIFVAALLATSTLYARDNNRSSGSMMGGGMMGGGMMGDGMMGESNMMGQMSKMMDYCSGMMQGGPRGNRPNDQWRKEQPVTPDKNG